MPPKRVLIGRSTAQAKRKKLSRALETNNQREARLETVRSRTAEVRAVVRDSQSIIDLNLSAFNYNPYYNYNLHPSVDIGKMNKVCKYCSAHKFKNETPGLFCANGKVTLPKLLTPPEPLSSLVSGNTISSKHFLANIRIYNSCFQMTSFGATNIVRENFMPTFKVQGQNYHHAGSLLPMPNKDYKFLQIYFMGSSHDQIDKRCRLNTSTKREIVMGLQTLFDQHNTLVKLFRTALEKMPADHYKVVIRAEKTSVDQNKDSTMLQQ